MNLSPEPPPRAASSNHVHEETPHSLPATRRLDGLGSAALAVASVLSPNPSRPLLPSPAAEFPSSVLPSFVSPAVSPPATPGAATPPASVAATVAPPPPPPPSASPTTSAPAAAQPPAPLLETLPEVRCLVRARIPTVSGAEAWLHMYENSIDKKDHLAIVFGPHIRSRSLDAPRPGETEFDRMVRGAYTGRLYPGRTESGMVEGSSAAATTATAATMTTTTTTTATTTTTTTTDPPLVRIHSECYTGETAWSARCDCGEQLDEAARLMSPPFSPSGGIIVYLRQEGRGIGLAEKLKAYNLQDLGSDTVEANLLLRHPADARSYGLATAVLLDLGQRDIRLLTNNPDKARAVEGPGREIRVSERVPMVPLSWRAEGKGVRGKEVEGYLKTKIEKMGHMLDLASMPR